MAQNFIRAFSDKEALSSLNITRAQLDIARIPAVDAPDWIIPRDLVLAVEDFNERIWTYLWRGQDVAVYHLLPKSIEPTQIVVVESATDVHRLGLQIAGQISYHTVRIADIKDVTLDDDTNAASHQDADAPTSPVVAAPVAAGANYTPIATRQDYVYQPIMFQDELCIVPNLDKLSHFLVDLDS